MDKKLQEEFKNRLLQERERLKKELAVITDEDLKPSQTDMSGENAYENDEADAATTTFERERDDSLGWNIRDMLNKIDTALTRFKEGTYGRCPECDTEIDIERLKAIPYADSCITCQGKRK